MLHAALYPDREPVCQNCRGELGKAYYAIQRWVSQQDASSTNPPSSNVKKTTTARFHSDELHYTPHGLGVTYSNANLTDKAARDILSADPDAARHFAVLPAEASAEEAAEDAAPATAPVEQALEPAATPPAGFDYGKLASALADEMERRHAGATSVPAAPVADAPALTASAGGAPAGVTVTTGTTAHDADDADHDDEKPVRLSRMGKDQLLATYRAELKLEPAEGLTNEELRQVIAEHRAAQQDPE